MARADTGSAFLGRVARLATRKARWVVLAWVAVTAALTVLVPQLEKVVAEDATPFLPDDAGAVSTFQRMDAAFGSGKAQSMAFVVLVADHRLSGDDEGYYRRLVGQLRGADDHVVEVQDFASQPQLRPALVSADGRATYVPVGLPHPVGSPEAIDDVRWLRTTAARGLPPGVTLHVTGDPATLADLNRTLENSLLKITLVTVVVIVAILLLIYRSVAAPLITLGTIGVALLVARGVVALLGESVLSVSTYTGTFITALVLGAGTDYSVFLVSRFHEALRSGAEPREAVVHAAQRIGMVIAASAATVAIGSVCMVVTKLALFRTTGPAIAVAVLSTLLVNMTLTPALLAIAGRRAGPRTQRGRWDERWSRLGALVASRPARVLLGCLVLLGALAALFPTLEPTYDTKKLEPSGTPSDVGYRALNAHFHGNELRPDYLLVVADHDLRNPRDLGVLGQAADSLAKVPGVASVRGVTRPQGKPIPQASLTYQMKAVGDRLGSARQRLASGGPQVDKLAGGARQLSGGADQLATGAGRATDAVDRFLGGLAALGGGLGEATDGTASARSGAAELRDGAAQLADGLRTAHDQTATAVRYLGLIYRELSADPVCTADAVCAQSRAGVRQVYTAQRDRLLPGLARAAGAADQISRGDGNLADGLGRLRDGLQQAQQGVDRLAAGERQFQAKLGQLAGGAAKLADGADLVPAGVRRITEATGRLEQGLGQASTYLTTTATEADRAGVSSFFLPPGAIRDSRFALARDYYLSKDGRTARFMVYGRHDVGEASERPVRERQAVEHALAGTPLAAAQVFSTGPAAVSNDIRDLSDGDFALVFVVVLVAVFLILVALLRALVAPLYLLATVVLSYAAAMGITTLFWQHLLHRPMDWTVPLLAFVVLVAVGADYNILLMTRVREESRTATRAGVARAVGATGGVITTAGLIFAGSFVAMTVSPVIGMAEIGFAVAVGLLLDTFVVRSLLVPSIAALLGRRNWWPGGRERRLGVPPTLRGLLDVTERRESLTGGRSPR